MYLDISFSVLARCGRPESPTHHSDVWRSSYVTPISNKTSEASILSSCEVWVEVYALSASKAIFRARTYSLITYSVWWWWLNFQILAYLLTIDLLYGIGCLSYWFCYYMLRLDSSEMLPGSQKGEEKAGILKPHARLRHFDSHNRCVQRWNG